MAPEPPFVTATISVILFALTLEILSSDTAPSAILVTVIALTAIVGAAAVPVKSPANCIFPIRVVVAFSIVASNTLPST